MLRATVVAFACAALLQGCVGFIVGTAIDVAVEVVKVPFKVGGAIIDAASDDDANRQE